MISLSVFNSIIVMFCSVSSICAADTGSTMSDGGQRADASVLQLINQESMLRLTLDKQLQELRSLVYDLKTEVSIIGESCKTQIPQRMDSFDDEIRSFRSNILNLTETMNDKISLSDDGINKLKYNFSVSGNELATSYRTLREDIIEKFTKINKDVSDLGINMSTLEGLISGVKDSPVYFSAFLGSSFTTKSSNEVIKFGSVRVNVGGGYNPGTGKFTCPKSGAYLLSYGYRSQTSTETYTDMYINNDVVMEAATPGDINLNSAEKISIHALTEGDEVYVKVATNGAELSGGNKYTSFSAMYID